MSFTEKIDVLDMLINIIQEHEQKMDNLVTRIEDTLTHMNPDLDMEINLYQRMAYKPNMAYNPKNIVFRRIRKGRRIGLPEDFLNALGWNVGDQLSLEILNVENNNKIVITNESQKYRKPLKERLNSGNN